MRRSFSISTVEISGIVVAGIDTSGRKDRKG